MEDQSVPTSSTTQAPITKPTPEPTQQSNPQKRKFKIILIGFFVLFFLTLGTAAAIYTFKEASRSQNKESQYIPLGPQPGVKSMLSPIPTTTSVSSECVVAGCSGQFCIGKIEAQDFVSTCEYSEKYACYKTATCKMQNDGKCGWTVTQELTSCLNSAQ